MPDDDSGEPIDSSSQKDVKSDSMMCVPKLFPDGGGGAACIDSMYPGGQKCGTVNNCTSNVDCGMCASDYHLPCGFDDQGNAKPNWCGGCMKQVQTCPENVGVPNASVLYICKNANIKPVGPCGKTMTVLNGWCCVP